MTPATEKQISFITALAAKRGYSSVKEVALALTMGQSNTLNRHTASAAIDWLKSVTSQKAA